MTRNGISLKAIILAGGRGTRLQEETEFKPKPMVEIGGRPIIWHIMKSFSHFGVNDFIICLGYKGQMVIDYFFKYGQVITNDSSDIGDKNKMIEVLFKSGGDSWNIKLVDTGLKTLTAKRLYCVRPYLDDDINIVTYGDGLANINISELIAFHRNHKNPATVSIAQPPGRFGVVRTDYQNQVTNFSEKPRYTDWVNCGYFVFNTEVFTYFENDEYLEVGPMLKLTNEKKLMAFKHRGYWAAMDTYREYLDLNEIWNSGKVPWKVWQDDN